MRVVHTLRNVPASRPGEPHQRSQEQLALLAKLLRNTPELKGFEAEALMSVLGAGTFVNAVSGHVLCKQGEVGDRFFAIIEGMVSVHVRPKNEVETDKSKGSALVKTMMAALAQHREMEARVQLPFSTGGLSKPSPKHGDTMKNHCLCRPRRASWRCWRCPRSCAAPRSAPSSRRSRCPSPRR